MTYLGIMRPEDILKPTPAGLCSQIGGFPHRSDAAGRQGADHARPFRSCARRPRRGAGDAGDARHDAPALRREFRRLHAGDPLWRDAEARRRRRCRSIRPATCSARRRSASPRTARASSRRATTRTCADPTCAPFELVPCDVFITEATFGLPVFRHGDPRRARSPSCCARSRCFPSARIWSAPIRSARRSA